MMGATVLSIHKPLRLPWAVVVDDLHCIYLGVTLKFIHLWFDKQNRGKDYYIGNKVRNIMGVYIHT